MMVRISLLSVPAWLCCKTRSENDMDVAVAFIFLAFIAIDFFTMRKWIGNFWIGILINFGY